MKGLTLPWSMSCGDGVAWGGGRSVAWILQGVGRWGELRVQLPGELWASVHRGLPSLLLPPGYTGQILRQALARRLLLSAQIREAPVKLTEIEHTAKTNSTACSYEIGRTWGRRTKRNKPTEGHLEHRSTYGKCGFFNNTESQRPVSLKTGGPPDYPRPELESLGCED